MKICKHCGKEYEGHSASKYCSDECRDAENNAKKIRLCELFGSTFESPTGKGRYCPACRKAIQERPKKRKVEQEEDYSAERAAEKSARMTEEYGFDYGAEQKRRILAEIAEKEEKRKRLEDAEIIQSVEINEKPAEIANAEASEDNVDHPKHYTGKTECIDAMLQTQGVDDVIAFCRCNAFKYLWRHKSKNRKEDLKKANWYLIKALELEEKNG